MPKTSAKELQRRKEAARRQDEHRRRMEAQIAEMEKQGFCAEQIEDALHLIPVKDAPAMEFLYDRLKGVEAKNVDRAMHRAMVDLLRSDIPLNHQSRQWIADLFWGLAFPNPPKEAQNKRRAKAAFAASLKRYLIGRGTTGLEAEQFVAETFGLTVAALRKRMERDP